MAESKCPAQFEEGQIFIWKTSKGNNITGVVKSVTESFVSMERKLNGRTDEVLFLPESLVARLEEDTVIWVHNS